MSINFQSSYSWNAPTNAGTQRMNQANGSYSSNYTGSSYSSYGTQTSYGVQSYPTGADDKQIYTQNDFKAYKFTANEISYYFKEVGTASNGTKQYAIEERFGFATIDDVRNDIFKSYETSLILNNYVNKDVTGNAEGTAGLIKTDSGKVITKTNYANYANELSKLTSWELKNLRQEALPKLIDDFTSGNLTYLQLTKILGAMGVEGTNRKLANNMYTISFNFEGKDYTITCNKAAATKSTDNVTQETLSKAELDAYNAPSALIEMYLEPAAEQDGETIVYRPKAGKTLADFEARIASKEPITESEAVAMGYTVIKSVEDLDQIRNNLDGKFMLMGDIDMSSVENWEPIGNEETPFTGILNGNGFTIKNLTYNSNNYENYGLFGVIEKAELTNINLDGVDFETRNPSRTEIVGALVGRAVDSLIADCTIDNAYMNCGRNGAGGLLIGDMSGSTVARCNTNGQIDTSGLHAVGGLCGESHDSNVVDCNANVKILDKGDAKVGGLIGRGYRTDISGCKVSGEIVSVHRHYSGYISADTISHDGGCAGGLVGIGDGNITNCEVSATVAGGENSGAFVGKLWSGTHINDCNFTGHLIVPGEIPTDTEQLFFGDKYYTNGYFTDYYTFEGSTFNGTVTSMTPDDIYNLFWGDKNDKVEDKYEYPALIDMVQDRLDMEAAAEEQGLNETVCNGVYSKTEKGTTVFYVWNSNDKEFELASNIKSINKDGSYTSRTGKTYNTPYNEQVAYHAGGYTPTVLEGIYEKNGTYYSFDPASRTFEPIDKSYFKVEDDK